MSEIKSKYFKFSELVYTQQKVSNTPNEQELSNLQNLVDSVLDPARDGIGIPITISSGFRCKSLNDIVGGASNSQHMNGEAADLKCADNKALFEYIRKNLVFDQLINEYNYAWIHVSFSRTKNRGQVLEITKAGTKHVEVKKFKK